VLEVERASAKAKAQELDRTTPDGVATVGSGGRARIEAAFPTESEEAKAQAKVDTSLIGRTPAELAQSKLTFILALVIVALVAAAAGLYLGGVIRI
jgi:hypothetical protein